MMLIWYGVIPLWGQDSGPPDLQMLMNLDLFRPPVQESEAVGSDSNLDDSTLEQIWTLNALGYLGNSGNDYQGTAAGDDASGNLEPPATPPSQETPQ
jgi:hypothetical protein